MFKRLKNIFQKKEVYFQGKWITKKAFTKIVKAKNLNIEYAS